MSSPTQRIFRKRWARGGAGSWGSAAALLSLGWAASAEAATCNVPNATYPTIQSAADDGNCTVIQVAAGTYTEQVSLGRTGMTLQGAGAGRTIIRSPATRQPSVQATTFYPNYTYVIEVRPGSGADILDLTVDGGSNSFCGEPYFGVRFNNATGSLQRVAVDNVRSPGADFGCQNTVAVAATGEAGGTASLSMLNSTVRNFQKVGVLINGSTAAGAIFNNVIRGVGTQAFTAQNAIQFSRGGVGYARRNIVSDVQYTGDACLGLASGIVNFQAGQVQLQENTFLNVDRGIYLQQNPGDQTIFKNRIRGGSAGIVSDSNGAGKVLISSNGISGITVSNISNAATCFPENGNGITVINETGSTLVGNSMADNPRVGILLSAGTSGLSVQQNQAVGAGTAEIQDSGTSNTLSLNACITSLPAGLCVLAP